MNSGFVIHAPTTQNKFKLAIFNQLSNFWLHFIILLFPPTPKICSFNINKSFFRVFDKMRHYGVKYVLFVGLLKVKLGPIMVRLGQTLVKLSNYPMPAHRHWPNEHYLLIHSNIDPQFWAIQRHREYEELWVDLNAVKMMANHRYKIEFPDLKTALNEHSIYLEHFSDTNRNHNFC